MEMKEVVYDSKTVDKDFPALKWGNKGSIVPPDFVVFVNLYYDDVKALTMEQVKSLLPITHDGYAGTYLQDWMITHEDANHKYPYGYKMQGKIYDWHGDRTTTDIVTAFADNEEQLYQRLLLQYMWYLFCNKEYAGRDWYFILQRIRFFKSLVSNYLKHE